MNQVYVYPGAKQLREIELLKTPRMVLNTPLLRYFPFEGVRAWWLQWKQRDMYGGMTQIRSLNGRPPRVHPVGERDFLMRPGVYGEHMLIDEMEMTLRTAQARPDQPVDVNNLVTQRQDQLLVRRFNRIEWLLWQLVVYGHFIVLDARGVIAHRDAYSIQTFTSSVPYSTHGTSTPMADFQNVALYGRGTGTDFGRRATAFCNRVTGYHINGNTNPADLGGRKINGGNNITTINDVNGIFLGNDLPQIEIYDETYLDELGNQVPYIPDGKIVVMGALLNGETHGNFRFVINQNNPGGEPAPYMKVIDRTATQVPPEIEVHDGWNGGPVIYYPGSIVTMDVGPFA